ncbi:MAG TPA: aldehyde dehydrogenase family protein, partial [Candidatus Angelobacter sp.]|nr:aldehyde dehydrogenase family protein [Candidatus Angelobacter sp.]
MSVMQAESAQAAIEVRNPATQETVGVAPIFSAQEISVAVDRARTAQERWATTHVADRLKLIRRFQQLLCEQKESVAAVVTREAGKPLAEAISTEILVVLDAAQFLLNHAAEFLRPKPVPHSNPVMKLKRGTLLREPYGVIGIVSPWNY